MLGSTEPILLAIPAVSVVLKVQNAEQTAATAS